MPTTVGSSTCWRATLSSASSLFVFLHVTDSCFSSAVICKQCIQVSLDSLGRLACKVVQSPAEATEEKKLTDKRRHFDDQFVS